MNTGAASSQTASPCPSLSSSNATHWSSYATSNRVNGSDTLISYDGAGNVTAAGNYEYLYDAEGRQCAVANLLTSSVTQYVYDAEGRRVASFPWPSGGQMPAAGSTCPAPASFGGLTGTTVFLHDSVGGLEATLWQLGLASGWSQDVTANGQLLASYWWQNQHLAQTPPPTLTFHLNDWLGTKRLDINQSGQAVSWWSSDPFGNYLTAHGAGTDPSARHFTGKERDTESGNDFFDARYYSSVTGRFLQPDPSGQYFANPENPQTWNLYAYVANNPLVNIDPFGLWIWSLGNCYYDTVASYVETNGEKEFQGYDTQPLGCFNPPPSPPPQQPQQPQKPQQRTPKIDCSKPPPMPPTPKGASIDANEQATKNHNAAWWLMQVRPGGAWDYKTGGQQFASFGNVNYGATCDAGLGKDLTFCQRGAGAAAYATATANVAQGGRWTAGPGSPTGTPANDNGMPDYGDQATGMENQSVIAGFGYAQWQKACGKQ